MIAQHNFINSLVAYQCFGQVRISKDYIIFIGVG